jgi:hypothetical protein
MLYDNYQKLRLIFALVCMQIYVSRVVSRDELHVLRKRRGGAILVFH